MKLYILRPKTDSPDNDTPWYGKYDMMWGFVVRANSETEARKFAQEMGGDETHYKNDSLKRESVWDNPYFTSCEELKNEGESGVIMSDFYAG